MCEYRACSTLKPLLNEWLRTASKLSDYNLIIIWILYKKRKLVSSAAALWWFSCRGCVRWNCLVNTRVIVEGRLWTSGSVMIQSSFLKNLLQVELCRQSCRQHVREQTWLAFGAGQRGRPVTAVWSAGWGFYWKLFPHFCPCFSGLFIVLGKFSSTMTFSFYFLKNKKFF